MIRSKKDLSQRITDICRNKEIFKNKELCREICTSLLSKRGIPSKIVSDIILLKVDPEFVDIKILFCIIQEISPNDIPKYFNEREIKNYENYVYMQAEIPTTLTFKCIQIDTFQWIGKITARELYDFYTNEIIRYNADTQRTMSHRQRKGHDGYVTEYYKITLNKKSVNSIKNLMSSGRYVPDTLTLNIPEEAEYNYNDETFELSISNFDHFDIVDGYHRYVAMCDLCATDPAFDYDMEIRFIRFSEDKANQFIYQAAQTNRLSKVDSDLLNKDKVSNEIVQMLNQEGVLYGKIGKNGKKIDAAVMSSIISLLFTGSKSLERKEIIAIKNNILKYLTVIINNEEEDIGWSNSYLFTILYSCSKDIEPVVLSNEEDKKAFEKRLFTKRDIERLEKVINERG